MVMFKHGVAYIERAGPASGPFELAFKRDEMNDVLKSLALWVKGGDATVGAVAFEKPEDPELALARRKLDFPPGGSLFHLLASMRGRLVAVVADGARLEGEVVGLEQSPERDGGERRTLLLRTGSGIALVELARATHLELLEESAKADLAFFIDRSRAASTGENRIVRVDLQGSCDELRVSYVVPAPAWRVSYRIARTETDTHLMAWGIVHNPVEEDLDDLALVLTTGQPVSFVIDLYNPKSVTRTVVEEQSRAASAPTHFERGMPPPPPLMSPSFAMPCPQPAMRLMAMSEGYGGPPTEAPEAMLGGGADAATFGDRGEFFEYRVGPRIALKRGGSAMVPLLAVKLDATKERIWRRGSPPAPDLVVSFKNTSNAVLEEGAAVIYDGDVYAGESMVPYSARGADVKLSFAKDLAVRCKHTEQVKHATYALHLQRDCLRVETETEWRHTFTAESDHAEPITITFELPLVAGRAFVGGTLQPVETTANYHRFVTEVPAGARVSVEIAEHQVTASRSEYAQLGGAQIDGWLATQLLDKSHAEAMREALGLFAEWRRLDKEQRDVAGERQALYEKQRHINEQLAVLKDGGPEAQLRVRYVRELEAAQDGLAALDAKEKRLGEASARASAAAWATIAAQAPPAN